MNGIYFTQKRIEDSPENYPKSKFLGSPVFPMNFLEEHPIGDNSYLLLQLNLEDIKGKQNVFPEQGYLYFFVDVDTLEPTVLYTEEEPMVVVDDFNSIFDGDYGETAPYELVFEHDLSEGHYLLGDINPDIGLEGDTDPEGKVTLLEIDALELPEEIFQFESLAYGIGRYVFLIKEADLIKRDFSHVELIDCGS